MVKKIRSLCLLLMILPAFSSCYLESEGTGQTEGDYEFSDTIADKAPTNLPNTTTVIPYYFKYQLMDPTYYYGSMNCTYNYIEGRIAVNKDVPVSSIEVLISEKKDGVVDNRGYAYWEKYDPNDKKYCVWKFKIKVKASSQNESAVMKLLVKSGNNYYTILPKNASDWVFSIRTPALVKCWTHSTFVSTGSLLRFYTFIKTNITVNRSPYAYDASTTTSYYSTKLVEGTYYVDIHSCYMLQVYMKLNNYEILDNDFGNYWR
jgi:hypothetical protein